MQSVMAYYYFHIKFDEKNKKVMEELKSLEVNLGDLSKRWKDSISQQQVAIYKKIPSPY